MPTATAPPSPAPLLAALRAEQPRASSSVLAQALARRYAPWLGAPDVAAFAASHAPGTLVRWRCMLQDTGLGRELVRAADCWRVEAGDADDDATAAAGDSQLAERAVVYACDVPGWSAWARRSWQRGAAAASDVGADEAAEAMRSMALGDDAPAYLDKHPLRDQPGAGALLKIYDDELADSLRVTQCVDVLGVLDTSALPGADWADADGSAPTPLVPALHVLALAPVDLRLRANAQSEAHRADAAQARREVVGYLKDALAGDELAAEWTLLAMLARIHSRRGPLLLGSLSLNLSGAALPQLHGALQALLPSVLRQSLALPHLNEARTRMAPSNDGAGEGLRAGRLQCVDGTALLIDETEMGEGTLGDRGVRNIRELSAMLTTRKLAYNFSYSTFDFDVDGPVVVLSTGKSLLPIDVWLPTSPSASTSAAAPAAASEEQLSRWRAFLAGARTAELEIPEQVAQQIQDEFVAARKEGQAGFKEGQEALLRRMGVARFVALSKGLSEMDLASWRRAVELDELRMTRVAAAGSGTATAAAAVNGNSRPSAVDSTRETPERRREARTSGDTLGSPPQP